MNLAASEYCQASMNYISDELPEAVPLQVSIANGRDIADQLDWRVHGFQLIQHASELTRWDDDELIKARHYDEVIALARELTGAQHALLGSHIRRDPEQAQRHADYAPIQFVHSDFTDNYGELVRQRYQSQEPDVLQALQRAGIGAEQVMAAERILILQFWRNVGPEAMDLPIAFCDARSVPRADLRFFHVPNYAGTGVPFDACGITAPSDPADHHWFVFPQMGVDETVAFRTFDTECVNQQRPYWTPHSAFADPNLRNPPPRASVELRVTCLF